MEVNFSTFNHRSLISTSSPLSLSTSRTLFLGSIHTLRSPPPSQLIRSRNNNRNRLGLLRVHSPRFVLKASFPSHPLIVVVVVVTLSAVSFLHFTRNNNNNTKKTPRNQTQGHAKFALSPQGSNVGNQVIDSQILGFPEFQKDKPLSEIGKLNDHKKEGNHVFEDQEIHLQFLKSSMVQQQVILETKTSDSSSSSSVLDTNASDNSTEVSHESYLSVPFPSSLDPLVFAEEMALQVDEDQDENDSALELPSNMVESDDQHNASSVSVNNALATINEHNKENIELPSISSDVLFSESRREGLYMFYEDNKSATGSMTPLRSVKSSAIGSTTLKGIGLSTDISLRSAEYFEGAVRISSHKGGYPQQNAGQKLRKGSRYPRDRERNYMGHDGNKHVLPQSAQRTRVHIDQKNDQIRVHDAQITDPSEHLGKYNNLLRAGRLSECIELLKDMETKGLLDMTKVYHAKFFNFCKKQKAVKEAFDYIRLIPNPTLSTFNMLMSVCTSSQDSEGAFQVMQLLTDARLEPDCKLYTTLISTCGKSGKVDLMFEVFHKMVNSGVEPNVHTYGALIDGCARAGQVGKAFGAYGILSQRHRWTGRYEAHLWDNSCKKEGQSRKGRQVYLGGYDIEEKAARAYDMAALKYWGPSTRINFPKLENYQKELEEMEKMTRQEFVAHLRRKSSGFSRGASQYRGVTRSLTCLLI